MANNAILILPNNLFDPSLLKHDTNATDSNKLDVIVIEHPIFWGNRSDRPKMHFNPLKLLYHRSSMYYWYKTDTTAASYLKPANYLDVDKYTKSALKKIISKYDTVFFYDPCDKQLKPELLNIIGEKRATILDSHLYYNTISDINEYHTKINDKKSDVSKHSYNHASFYKWMRARTDILPGSKTYDTENRNKMPLDTKVPPLPSSGAGKSPIKTALQQGSTVVSSSPKGQRKDLLSRLVFPIDRASSLSWLRHFCKHRLSSFGEYQDAIDSKGRGYLFHSCISPMLNIGLITPHDVIKEVQGYYEKHKATIPIASYEGFMRQVIGWREYQRYLYEHAYTAINDTNHFGNKRRLRIGSATSSTNPWYNGTTGIVPVDDAIKHGFETGYLHHIQRLMVMGNFMNLVGVHPEDVYKWFMEFALDSYDWVMVGNVYSMALWSDAGVSMRKPYISSDSYVMKMSTYEKAEWNDIWYALFYDFVRRNSKQLKSTYYAGMVKHWNNKTSEEQKKLIATASEFIERTTTI